MSTIAHHGGHKKRISREAREEIVRLFHHVSVDDAVRYGERLGLQERYIIRLAQSRALHT